MGRDADVTIWSVDDVVEYLESIGYAKSESAVRDGNIDGKELIGYVDEPLSTLQQVFDVTAPEAKDLRQHIREHRRVARGVVDEVGRSMLEERPPFEGFEEAKRALVLTRGDRLNIVTVGKTGQGKSATLNSFLYYNGVPEQPFVETSGIKSGTKTIDIRSANIAGYNVRLVDTVGLFDTDYADDVVKRELARTIQVCSEGVHAFLIAVKATERLTEESRKSIDIIRQYFGTELLKYAFFVMTGGDMITDPAQRKEQIKILSDYVGLDLKNRVIFFDNKSRDPEQIERLLDMITDNVALQGGPYTNAAFEIAQEELQRAIEAERRRAEEDKQREIDKATESIRKAHEIEGAELRERFKNDQEALRKALDQQQAEMKMLVRRAEQNAEKKYNEQVTVIMRKHEDELQANHAKQLDIVLKQQKEMQQQFSEQIRTLNEQHDKEIKEQQSLAMQQQQDDQRELRSQFENKIKTIQDQHAKLAEEQRLASERVNQEQQKQLVQMLEMLESNHKAEIKKLQDRIDLDGAARQRRQQELNDKFETQMKLQQQMAADAAKQQAEQMAALHREQESKQGSAVGGLQQQLAMQLAAIQAQAAEAQAKAMREEKERKKKQALAAMQLSQAGQLAQMQGGGGGLGLLKLELCSLM